MITQPETAGKVQNQTPELYNDFSGKICDPFCYGQSGSFCFLINWCQNELKLFFIFISLSLLIGMFLISMIYMCCLKKVIGLFTSVIPGKKQLQTDEESPQSQAEPFQIRDQFNTVASETISMQKNSQINVQRYSLNQEKLSLNYQKNHESFTAVVKYETVNGETIIEFDQQLKTFLY